MMDMDKMLENLEEMLDTSRYQDSVEWNPYADTETLENVIALLKSQQPRVMTLIEACGAEVCWIEKRIQRVVTVCKVRVYGINDYSAFINYMLPYRNENISQEKYGIYWRCWTSRPTDEQREAEPWKQPI